MTAGDEELFACLSLRHGLGLGARTVNKLLERFGSAVSATRNAKVWKSLGLATARQAQGFLGQSWRENAEKEFAQARELGARTLCWSEPAYPARLRETGSAPALLYYRGDISLLHTPCLAVVGSRDASRYGIELARRIAGDLSRRGLAIVSGLASGIDREAHLGGLSGPGGSIAVLGTGIDLVYPATNRDVWSALCDNGLVVTEFAPGTKPLGANFPQRNRILSGISLGVLVVEAGLKSGSLITARLAMEQGREVFAMPGPVSLPSYRGCHELINQGARLVHEADDVLAELAPQIEVFVRNAAGAAPGGARVSRSGGRETATTGARGAREVSSPGTDVAAAHRETGPAAETPRAGGRPYGPAADAPPGRPPGPVADDRTTRIPPRPEHPTGAGTGCAGRQCGLAASGQTSLADEVAQHLGAMGATHIDSLCRLFHVEVAQMSGLLVVLELKGVVRRLPGGYYLTA